MTDLDRLAQLAMTACHNQSLKNDLFGWAGDF
jgi:hypothetical protein